LLRHSNYEEWGLRDYGVEGQIGLEPTLEEYLENLLAVTKELNRILKNSGILFWNHGDCYGGSACGKGDFRNNNKRSLSKPNLYVEKPNPQLKLTAKSMALQNYRLILKMIDEQKWILRNILIWYKPNCMPSSVKDRFTNTYEPIFMLVKNKHYYFDLDTIREPLKEVSIDRVLQAGVFEEEGGKKQIGIEDARVSSGGGDRAKCAGSVKSLARNYLSEVEYFIEVAERLGIKEEILDFLNKRKKSYGSIGRLERARRLMEETGLPITPKNKYYQKLLDGNINEIGMAGIVTGRFIDPLANTGANNKEPYKENNPHKQRRYRGKFNGFGEEAEIFGSPRARTQRLLVKDKGLTEIENLHGVSTEQGRRIQLGLRSVVTRTVKDREYKSRDPERHISLLGKNPGDHWTINTQPFSETHFAVFPEELCVKPILAGCPERGLVLDPFVGSGTTCVVAKKLGRDFIGIDISEKYCQMARKRLAKIPERLDRWIVGE
jgi:DNA modification methylase